MNYLPHKQQASAWVAFAQRMVRLKPKAERNCFARGGVLAFATFAPDGIAYETQD